MSLKRREFLKALAAGAALVPTVSGRAAQPAPQEDLIIDTHQHLWNLSQLNLPWLAEAPEVLRRDFGPPEYREATEGMNIKAIYMEVDVATTDHDKEAEYVIGLCRSGQESTIAAVIGGRPDDDSFGRYLDRHREGGFVKGVRQVLHNPSIPAGHCLRDEFVRGIRLLGERGLSFDLCMRPGELSDAAKLVELCPGTRFILDHCGNADVKAFMRSAAPERPSHNPDAWRRDIETVAKRANVICKISGIVASAPQGWQPDDLAPIVNHCLDTFGPDRVVFGGDWPVCLLGAPLAAWVRALRAIVQERPRAEQNKLWSANARRHYGLA